MDISCSHCGCLHRIEDQQFDRLIGRHVKCSSCKQVFTLVEEQSSAVTMIASSPPSESPSLDDWPDLSLPEIDLSPGPKHVHLPQSAADRAVLLQQSRRRRQRRTLIAIVAAGTIFVIAAIAALFLMRPDDKQQVANLRVKLGIDVEREIRDRLIIHIDGEQTGYPAVGVIEFNLKPGPHTIELFRTGFEPWRERVSLLKKRKVITPQWKPARLPDSSIDPVEVNRQRLQGDPFVDWQQDFEKAKQMASEEGKSILLYFDQSDRPDCATFNANVMLVSRFQRAVEKQFVLVHVDSPLGSAARNHIEDAQRNQTLCEYFELEQQPLVIATDSDGLPFAYVSCTPTTRQMLDGVDRSLDLLQERDRLFEKSESDLRSGRWTESCAQALGLICYPPFAKSYMDKLESWVEIVRDSDPDNKNQVLGYIYLNCQRTKVLVADSFRERSKLIGETRDWLEKGLEFDIDQAADFYLASALTVRNHDVDLAKKLAADGLALKPKNVDTIRMLQLARRIDYASIGTGFMIGDEGHLLTNHHVVEQKGNIVAISDLDKQERPVRIVAVDPGRDLALLQLKDHTVETLQPFNGLYLSATPAIRGADIYAFGYPDLENSSGMRQLKGNVGRDETQRFDGLIELDMDVNGGNSGGPICSVAGEVIGVVVAKTLNTTFENSIGLAIPNSVVIEFLRKQWGDDRVDTITVEGSETAMPPDQMGRRVNPGVFLIVVKREQRR